MATIRPFKGIRPVKDKVHMVVTRSVDRYKPAELNAKMSENPYTFFHVIKPEFNSVVKSRPGSIELLRKIKKRFLDLRESKILVQDPQPSFYIYQQIASNSSSIGIIACSATDDYENGVIKIHEQTIKDREEKLKQYLEVCDFNAEPICMSYPDDTQLNEFINNYTTSIDPVYDFTTTDTLRHKLWIVDNTHAIEFIVECFKQIPHIYIADGHHRSASSALLAKELAQKNSNHTGNENYNFYMCIFFPESQLKILAFNRLVKDLNTLTSAEFIQKLSKNFDIKEHSSAIEPTQLHTFGMYLEGKWYELKTKKSSLPSNSPVANLDSQLLSDLILGPILNIKDLRTDKRIAFISEVKGIKELQSQVDTGKMKAAFTLFPVSMQQLKHIADTNNIMPPKSTWVEPKLRSGLVIYSISD